jgi:hypothetical protein
MLQKEGYFFKCYDYSYVMPRLDATNGSGIWSIQRPYGAMVGSIHCLDTIYLIKNNASNGC